MTSKNDPVIEHMLAMLDRPAMVRILPGMPLGEHFAALRHNYIEMAQRVCEGLESWGRSNRDLIAPWHLLMTPIESAVWEAIRNRALPFWPQFPVGRFFLDFGCPMARVGVECDGAEFHDPVKDAARDAELALLGWTIYRIPGWRCVREVDAPPGGETPSEFDAYRLRRDRETLHGILDELTARHLPARPRTVGGMA